MYIFLICLLLCLIITIFILLIFEIKDKNVLKKEHEKERLKYYCLIQENQELRRERDILFENNFIEAEYHFPNRIIRKIRGYFTEPSIKDCVIDNVKLWIDKTSELPLLNEIYELKEKLKFYEGRTGNVDDILYKEEIINNGHK